MRYKSCHFQTITQDNDFYITFEENETDFWDELPAHVQKGILDAKSQVAEGNYKVHEDVMEEYNKRYK